MLSILSEWFLEENVVVSNTSEVRILMRNGINLEPLYLDFQSTHLSVLDYVF